MIDWNKIEDTSIVITPFDEPICMPRRISGISESKLYIRLVSSSSLFSHLIDEEKPYIEIMFFALKQYNAITVNIHDPLSYVSASDKITFVLDDLNFVEFTTVGDEKEGSYYCTNEELKLFYQNDLLHVSISTSKYKLLNNYFFVDKGWMFYSNPEEGKALIKVIVKKLMFSKLILLNS